MWEGEYKYRHQVFLVWLPFLFSIGTFLGINIVRIIDVVHRDPENPGNDGLGGFFYFIGINLKYFIYKRLLGKNMPAIYTSLNVWSAPKFRTVFWAYLGGLYYFIPALLILTMLMLPHFFKLGDQGTNPLSTAILSAIGVALLSYINGKGRPDSTKRFQKFLDFSEGIRNALLTILLFILIISIFFIFSTLIDRWVEGKEIYSSMTAILVVTIISLFLFILISWLINYNHISQHYFYRDRIVDAFLKTDFNMKIGEEREKIVVARDHSSMKLININPKGSSTPYHIVVTAINLPGSWYLRFKDRKSQQFIFSRYWCGSEITGYLPSIEYRSGLTRYSRTIALSGAAISPGLGYRTFFAQAFAFTMLNVRLGLWMDNPIYYHNQKEAGSYFKRWKGPIRHEQNVLWHRYLCYEAFATMNERKKLINITDGGHTGDNGGLCPLFKRRCRVIIAGDASLDPDYKGEQLYKVLNQVKTDEGIEVEIDIQGIKPEGGKEGDQERGYSKHHFAVGKIDYPETESAPKSDGWLIYFKPAVCESDPGWIKYYHEMYKEYPHPDTSDQFYNEEQLEAQRMLGEESVIIAFGDILLKAIKEDVSRVKEVEKKMEQEEVSRVEEVEKKMEQVEVSMVRVPVEVKKKMEQIKEEVMQEPENIQTALKSKNDSQEEENSSKKEQETIDKESEKPENRDMVLRKSLNQGLNFFSLYNKCPFTEDNLVSLYLLSKSTKSINEPIKLDNEN
jgi:hypothetical protein